MCSCETHARCGISTKDNFESGQFTDRWNIILFGLYPSACRSSVRIHISTYLIRSPTMSAKRPAADAAEDRTRFQIELEFVQCLANPNYLNFLAQRKYLQMPKFVAYLRYLQYWRQPEYAKYLRYPMCLHFLDLLQYEHFRKEISSSHAAKFIEDQQLLHWQHYIRKRSRMLNDAAVSRQQRQPQ